MTQRSCCVPGCMVKLGDGVLLHRFPNPGNPTQIERFRTWVMKIGGDIVREDNGYIYSNRKVCHRHFQEEYIFPSMKLSALAIPTLHIPGVHVGPHRNFVPTAESTPTTQELPTIPVDEDEHIQNVRQPEKQTTVEVSFADQPSTSADIGTNIPLNKGCRKIARPLTAVEKHLKDIICETKMKLRKSQNVRRKLKIH